jgi:hypothetical protein
MHRTFTSILVAATVAAVVASVACAQGAAPGAPGIVSNVKVLSNKIPDISSLEAWKKSYIKDGMSEKDKAMAVFTSQITYQMADNPPSEYLQLEESVLDPLKTYNVYGYCLCSISAADMAAMARYVGLQGRNFAINNHVVPEIYFDKTWHLMDADLVEYFPKADGTIASLQEVIDGVNAWLKAHPEYPAGDAKKRYDYMKDPGWKTGPEILSRNPYYDARGWLPCRTFAWGDTMLQFRRIVNDYASVTSMGYQVNVQLRAGERLTRNWSNKGLHIMQELDGSTPHGVPGALTAVVGKSSLSLSPKLGDLANGRIGNGTLEYDVPLATGEFRAGALQADNLASKADDNSAPAVHVKDAAKPATLDIRMPSSYVYLSGKADVNAVLGDGGTIKVLLSDNNGLDWKPVATIDKAGQQTLDIRPLIYRKYVYVLRFVMNGKGTGLDALKFTHDIQHSQCPLPALDQGDNTITFSAGPQEGTISIEGNMDPDQAQKYKQLAYTDFHPTLVGYDGKSIPKSDGSGSVTYTVNTPGDMTRIRAADHFYNNSGTTSFFTIAASFDQGKTWKVFDQPTAADMNENGRTITGRYAVCSDVPKGTRSAQVRFEAQGNGSTLALRVSRVDADYLEPAGGFRPVKVTYVWEEGGVEKKDVHVASKANDTYKIKCDSKPVMKSIITELAQPAISKS